MNKILVVDDELSIRESFSLILEEKYQVLTAASGEGALKIATDHKIDLVFLDIRMPGLDGLETLTKLKEIDRDLEVIMVTAVNDVQKANEAIKLGARDYIIKPFDVNTVLKLAESVLRRKNLHLEEVKAQKEAFPELPQLLGQSEKIVEIIKTAEKIAESNQRVLILGEAGTEKEIVAMFIHNRSSRRNLPFHTFSLTDQMTAAEIKIKLWGKSKGLTTAELQKISGLFPETRGGSFLLNHIEYLPAELIPQLPEEIRLMASSTKSLEEIPKDLTDLFKTVIFLPPLRERISDLPLLIKYYLEKFSFAYGRETPTLSEEALEVLANYPWPGNTAELTAFLERLILTRVSQISANQLPLDMLLSNLKPWGQNYLARFEEEFSARSRTRTGTVYSTEGF